MSASESQRYLLPKRREKKGARNIQIIEVPERRRRAPILSENKLPASNTQLGDRRRKIQVCCCCFVFFYWLYSHYCSFQIRRAKSLQARTILEKESQRPESHPQCPTRSPLDFFEDGECARIFCPVLSLCLRPLFIAALAPGTDEIVSFRVWV